MPLSIPSAMRKCLRTYSLKVSSIFINMFSLIEESMVLSRIQTAKKYSQQAQVQMSQR